MRAQKKGAGDTHVAGPGKSDACLEHQLPKTTHESTQASPGRQQWAERIRESAQRTVEAFVETGRLLIKAKAELPHGDFLQMIESDLPFQRQTAELLMRIARNPKLAKRQNSVFLPPVLSTLDELCRLDPDELEARIASGEIHPRIRRADIATNRLALSVTISKQEPRELTREEVSLALADIARTKSAEAPSITLVRPTPVADENEAFRSFVRFTLMNIESGHLKISGDPERMRKWRDLKERVEPLVKPS